MCLGTFDLSHKKRVEALYSAEGHSGKATSTNPGSFSKEQQLVYRAEKTSYHTRVCMACLRRNLRRQLTHSLGSAG